ncbi:clathrin interactor 1-like isoform X3 [Lineus longissimus]|uniref:clathrin interactor 1-like isoform X3 n=1 Tax=Lineus longissimus TaxID=88925 RepID=UPI00315D8D4D
MWKVREIADKVTNVVMNYSEVEAKVREATNDDPWGPTGTLKSEIAQYTFTYEHFPEVMGMLWKRMLHDNNKKNWRRVYKSLLLLSYLIKNGSERVVTSAREHLYDLRSLEGYTFTDEFGKDQGLNVRQKTKDLLEFIQSDDRLREERKLAKKNKDKYVGMSKESLSGNYSDRYDEEPKRVEKPSQLDSKLDNFDDWDKGNRSKAVEALDKVKEFWNNRRRSFDDTPDHSQIGSTEDPPYRRNILSEDLHVFGSMDDPKSLRQVLSAIQSKRYSVVNDEDYPDERDSNGKYEFKDDDEEFTHKVERTHTTKTEKITTNRRSRGNNKKIDLGAASSYGGDRDSVSQTSISSDPGPHLIDTSPSKRSDPFGEELTTNANGDFADFDSLSRARTVSQSSNDFGDFAAFGSQKTPTSPSNEFGDFAAFNASSTKTQQTTALQTTTVTKSSSVDLLSGLSMPASQPLMPSSQPIQPVPSGMALGLQQQTTPAPGMMSPVSPPMGMAPMMAPMGQSNMAGMNMVNQQGMMGANVASMNMGMTSPSANMTPNQMRAQQMQQQQQLQQQQQQQQQQQPMQQGYFPMQQQPNMMGQGMMMQPQMMNQMGMQQQQTPGVQPVMSSMSATSSAASTPSKTSALSMSSTKMNNTWSNTGSIDISLNDLSPASKYQKHQAPSINQLQQQQSPVMPGYSEFGNFRPNNSVMNYQGVGGQPNNMYVTNQQGYSSQGLTQGMQQMNMGQANMGMNVPPSGVQMGLVGTGMTMQTMSMNTAKMQQRADQAFGTLGNFK